MVLLTSGQVSIAISSVVVFLFTFALFLSGYVLQQKTVNDIRAAIKPQLAPLRPDIVLPPKFREGEFWDGKEQVIIVDAPKSPGTPSGEESQPTAEKGEDDMTGATRWQKAAKLKEKGKIRKEAEEGKAASKPISKSKKKKKTKVKEEQSNNEKTLGPAERRKKIKEEILAAGEGEGFKGYRRRMW